MPPTWICSGLIKISILISLRRSQEFGCEAIQLFHPFLWAHYQSHLWTFGVFRSVFPIAWVTDMWHLCSSGVLYMSCLHIIYTPLTTLSFISSMRFLYVPFTITEFQQDENCFKRLTTDVNRNTCIITAKIIMKFKLQVE